MNDAVLSSRKPATLTDDILLTFLMTFTYAAYSYEARLDERIMNIFRMVLLAVFALTWIITAVKNGLNKKIGFAVYTAALWLIPQLIIILFYNGPEFLRHSVIMYTLSEFSAVLINRPVGIIGEYCGITAEMSLIITLLIISGAFFAGFAFSRNKEGDTNQV